MHAMTNQHLPIKSARNSGLAVKMEKYAFIAHAAYRNSGTAGSGMFSRRGYLGRSLPDALPEARPVSPEISKLSARSRLGPICDVGDRPLSGTGKDSPSISKK